MICFACGGLLYYTVTICLITIDLVLIINYINTLVFAVNDMNGLPCRNIFL